jgi:hypothetical protein
MWAPPSTHIWFSSHFPTKFSSSSSFRLPFVWYLSYSALHTSSHPITLGLQNRFCFNLLTRTRIERLRITLRLGGRGGGRLRRAFWIENILEDIDIGRQGSVDARKVSMRVQQCVRWRKKWMVEYGGRVFIEQWGVGRLSESEFLGLATGLD